MATTRQCPNCGAELPADATEGLCPKCLLQVGLDESQHSGSHSDETSAPAQANSVADPPPLGTKVKYVGDYELLEEIARGGMGVVYKARQLSLNRMVALKMILAGQLAGDADLQRFHTEAEAAANLQHPNIVAIHEVGEHEGHHYFSMDLVDGRSLKEIVREHPIQSQQAARYLQTIALAIHYAHGQGTLHRDLKPSNVVIDENDEPQITDFGLAKRFETDADLTGTGQILGTPGYLPPEQAGAKHAEVGPASDIYSLGAVLYELLTGRPPFRAETPLETIRQVLDAEPAAPRLLNPKIPRDLETICLKCLEKSPGDRYQSAEDLAEDLGRFLNDEPILARPIGRIDRVRRRVRKFRKNWRPIAATVAVTFLIFVTGLVSWRTYLNRQYENQGELILETDGPIATAEILDAEDQLIVPRFTVPNVAPVRIPAGEYRLRLSAEGFFDETYQLLIERAAEHRFTFDLRDQLMWPPIEVARREHAAVVRLDKRDDIIHLTDRGIRRIDGFSGEPLWETTIEADSPALRAFPNRHWHDLAKGNWNFPEAVHVTENGADLNDDGTDDLVFFAQDGNSVFVVSGNDGQVLWVWQQQPTEEQIQEHTDGRLYRFEMALHPVLADVDGDDASDVIVGYNSRAYTGSAGNVTPPSWIEAISGRSGQTLWRRRLDRGLGYRPEAVVDGDQLVIRYDRRDTKGETGLTVLDLKTGAEITTPPASITADRDRPLDVDLDGDGKLERIKWFERSRPSPDTTGRVGIERGIELTDAISGARRWQSLVIPHDVRHRKVASVRFVAGPDLDRDGFHDVFVTYLEEGDDYKDRIRIHALSGAAGEVLWSNQQQLPKGIGMSTIDETNLDPPIWFQIGADGWPQLLLLLRYDERNMYPAQYARNVAYFISASDGRIVQTIDEVGEAIVADLDGDNLSELCWLGRSKSQREDLQGEFRALRGIPPAVWRRLGQLHVTEDLNGDSIHDLISDNSGQQGNRRSEVAAVSGRDGTVLWRKSLAYNKCYSAPPADGDLDGDGISDVIFHPNSVDSSYGTTHYWLSRRLLAISGKTGKTLWAIEDIAEKGADGDDSSAMIGDVHYRDLDSDGHPDVLCGYNVSGGEGIEGGSGVAAIGGRDGTRIWNYMCGASVKATADLDGDGVPEAVCVTSTECFALRGTDGKLLWSHSADLSSSVAVETTATGDVLVMNQDPSRRVARVHSIDGKSGRLKWKYEEQTGRSDFAKLLVVNPGDRRASTIHLVFETTLVELDLEGRPLRKTRFPRPVYSVVGASDLTGDGKEELLFTTQYYIEDEFRDNASNPLRRLTDKCPAFRKDDMYFFSLRAARLGEPSLLWDWPFPYGWGGIVSVVPGNTSSDSLLVTRSNNRIYGMSAATGRPYWRCDALQPMPEQRNGRESLMRQMGDSDFVEEYLPSLLTPAMSDLPRAAFARFDKKFQVTARVCRLVLPTDREGRYLSPLDAAGVLHPEKHDSLTKEPTPVNERSPESILLPLADDFPFLDNSFQAEMRWYFVNRCYDLALAGRIEEARSAESLMIEAYERMADEYESEAERYRQRSEDRDSGYQEMLSWYGRWRKRETPPSRLEYYSNCDNDLAWFLVSCPVPRLRDADKAVELADAIVGQLPENGKYWNTLGAAQVRAGQNEQAVESLKKSLELQGDNGPDFFFLAMAYRQLGETEKAKDFFQRAVKWMDKNNPNDEELRRFRAEAALLIYGTDRADP